MGRAAPITNCASFGKKAQRAPGEMIAVVARLTVSSHPVFLRLSAMISQYFHINRRAVCGFCAPGTPP